MQVESVVNILYIMSVLNSDTTDKTDAELAAMFKDAASSAKSIPENDSARHIGVTLYEAPTIRSGWVSASLIDDYGFRSKQCCEEHFNSRQQAGRTLVSMFGQASLTKQVLSDKVDMYRQVHLVSSEENIRLSPIQNGKNTRNLSPTEQYKMAGIVLKEDKGSAPSWFYKMYVIDGVMFDNIHLAAEHTSLSYAEIRKRCTSSAKKWVQWQVFNKG